MPVKLRERRLVRLRQLSMLTHTHPRLFMGSARTPRHAPAPASLPPGDERALLEQARSLQRASAAGRVQPLLRGKNLGLLCADDTQAQALLFRQAASELGAHVAHIGMSLSECSAAQEVTHTARMLGRLYDAVECQGLPTAMVQQMAECLGHRRVRRPGQQRAADFAPGRATGRRSLGRREQAFRVASPASAHHRLALLRSIKTRRVASLKNGRNDAGLD